MSIDGAEPGAPSPRGAAWDGRGVNFSIFSSRAERMDLCLFDDGDVESRLPLRRTGDDWHGYVPGVGPGQRYGFRASGASDVERGLRFDTAKLLLDPYAHAIEGRLDWDAPGRSTSGGRSDEAGVWPDGVDTAPAVPRSVVVDPAFDWAGDAPPATPWADTVIYEAHVKGFTMRHPDVPVAQRGTYAGLASDAATGHLRALGVTAVELLPVHHIVDEELAHRNGLTNYWGYSTIGYFAPNASYAAAGDRGQQVHEFKAMVRALHRAGIEVILDVVYNHTAEGGHRGPTLSFRGLDNPVYYRLAPDAPGTYQDFSGTGNALDVSDPVVLQLVLDSLRYWVGECHVDGFRFDLATSLARRAGTGEVDWSSPFFTAVRDDPVLAGVKLIAEPWDLGPDGYQIGRFPSGWSEWNGVYRDTVRDFWAGRAGVAGLAARLTGSADLYDHDGRGPDASVNFVTAHDGFTLADLVSYETKHNEANGEANRDGSDDNRSWNCGVEGPSGDPTVRERRARSRRNLLTTLLLAQSPPMLVAGDELCRTQSGNNNAWCQDNEVSWLDWRLDAERRLQLRFTTRLLQLRRTHAVFRRPTFLAGRPGPDGGMPDAAWFRADGEAMTSADWEDSDLRVVALFLDGEQGAGAAAARAGEGASFLLLVNGSDDAVSFVAPPGIRGHRWTVELSTADPEPAAATGVVTAGGTVGSVAGSVTVLRRLEPG